VVPSQVKESVALQSGIQTLSLSKGRLHRWLWFRRNPIRLHCCPRNPGCTATRVDFVGTFSFKLAFLEPGSPQGQGPHRLWRREAIEKKPFSRIFDSRVSDPAAYYGWIRKKHFLRGLCAWKESLRGADEWVMRQELFWTRLIRLTTNITRSGLTYRLYNKRQANIIHKHSPFLQRFLGHKRPENTLTPPAPDCIMPSSIE
jgi:hypothetical protein